MRSRHPSPPNLLLTDLEWVFLGCEQPLVAPPALDEGEAAGLAGRVGQRVHHILKWTEKQSLHYNHNYYNYQIK